MSAYISEQIPEIAGATHIKYISLGIDDAHEIRGVLSRTSPGESIIISCGSVSAEAQDALLKIFEEPAMGIDIYFIYPYPESLLPALRSRLIRRKSGDQPALHDLTDKFLLGNSKDRGVIVKQLVDNEVSSSEILTLLTSIEWKLYKQGVGAKAISLRATLDAKERILTGTTPKMIMSHLAAVL
jgi:hypothetical protein